MKLSDIIIPGDKIDIKMSREQHAEENGGQIANVFQSSVCDYLSDMELEITMPTQGGRTVLFQLGARCEFVFYTRRGMYSCSGSVTNRYRQDNLFLLAVRIEGIPRKFQRREFFRVDYLADVQYYEISEEVALLPTTEQLFARVQELDYRDEVKRATMRDISGGGVKFTSSVPLESGAYVLLMVRLTNDCMDETFYLVCQIVGSDKHPSLEDTYCSRGKFLFKDLKDREKIVKFVFEEERRIRRRENE